MSRDVDVVLRDHGVSEEERELAEELVRAYLNGETTFRTIHAEVESLSQDALWDVVKDIVEIVDIEDT